MTTTAGPNIMPREPASLPALLAADEGVASSLESVLSDHTRRVYGTQWRIFTGWCDEVGLSALPAEPLTVARYLAARANSGASIATIRLAMSAISKAHEWAKLESPCRDPGVRASSKGWGRRLSKPQRQSGALTADVLAVIRLTAVQPRKRGRGFETTEQAAERGKFDVALVAVLSDAGLRRSEAGALTWSDVQRWEDGSGRITVVRSKTDAEAQGAVVAITPAAMGALSAIRPAGVASDVKVFGLSESQIARAEGALATLPGVEAFPENGIVLLESLEARAQTADQELASAEERVKRAKADVDQEIEHLDILEQSDKVRDLTYARSAFDQSVKDLPERRVELSAKRSELSASLANLGQDWDADRLNSFDLSLVVREEVASHGERLQNARTNLERSHTTLAQEAATLTEAEEDAQRARADRDGIAPPELEESDIRERRRRIRQSRGALDELGRAEDRSRDLWIQIGDEPQPDEATPNSGVTQLLTGLLGILGVGVLVAGILVSIALSPAGGSVLAVIGAVLFTTAVFLFFRSSIMPVSGPCRGD